MLFGKREQIVYQAVNNKCHCLWKLLACSSEKPKSHSHCTVMTMSELISRGKGIAKIAHLKVL